MEKQIDWFVFQLHFLEEQILQIVFNLFLLVHFPKEIIWIVFQLFFKKENKKTKNEQNIKDIFLDIFLVITLSFCFQISQYFVMFQYLVFVLFFLFLYFCKNENVFNVNTTLPFVKFTNPAHYFTEQLLSSR